MRVEVEVYVTDTADLRTIVDDILIQTRMPDSVDIMLDRFFPALEMEEVVRVQADRLSFEGINVKILYPTSRRIPRECARIIWKASSQYRVSLVEDIHSLT